MFEVLCSAARWSTDNLLQENTYESSVFWITMMLRQWSFAVLLLSIPLPVQGRPIQALSHRLRRSVGHAQLMHDRGRYLQERKRRLWLQELFKQVHTANVWDTPSDSDTGLHAVTWGAHSSKPASSTKEFPVDFEPESTGSTDTLLQETNKEQTLQGAAKRKKRVCLGKWRDGTRRRGWPCLGYSSGPMRGP
ncbi:parathyroid hormone-like hormone b [Astyanax mexicanus]|uniref:parathyroid hormone-like hormone b n=1 Tax=Astyanax mexicanus TaxID=7994 RepID=UPI0020CB4B86|nr:parathyroid hormone-like hormone b [Astyanax mexicanus]